LVWWQQESFSEDINQLRRCKIVKSQNLQSFLLFIDPNGKLRQDKTPDRTGWQT
jgi:hypothetical protein